MRRNADNNKSGRAKTAVMAAVLVISITAVSYSAYKKAVTVPATGIEKCQPPITTQEAEPPEPRTPPDDAITIDLGGRFTPEQAGSLLNSAMEQQRIFSDISISIPEDYRLELTATAGEDIGSLAGSISELEIYRDMLSMAQGARVSVLCGTGDGDLAVSLIKISMGALEVNLPQPIDITGYIIGNMPEKLYINQLYAKDGEIFFAGQSRIN